MKNIYIIINPSAGADYPILSVLSRKLKDSPIKSHITVAQQNQGIKELTLEALDKKVDAVAVYGGDGSIIEAAKILYTTSMPLVILPGGTANILAKELKIPTNIEQAIDVLLQKKKYIQKIDVGLCNNIPFFLRVSIGLMADMVIQADSNLKKTVGQLAYPITAIQNLSQIQPTTYSISVDNTFIEDTGYSLVVANSGNVGFPGFSVTPDISVTDGILNVFLIKNALDPRTQTLTQWHGKRITVLQGEPYHQITCDDDVIVAKKLKFSIASDKLHVLVPTAYV